MISEAPREAAAVDRDYMKNYRFSFGGITRVVKWLVIINAAVMGLYLLGLIVAPAAAHAVYQTLGLDPDRAILGGWVWQLATYSYLHSISPWHILMNMLVLWMFGRDIEMAMGPKRFFWVYTACGVAGGISYAIFELILAAGQGRSPLGCVGASGAVMGILAIYALYYPNREVIFLIFPLKAKYLVIFLIAVNVWTAAVTTSGQGDFQVAAVAHLGGAAFGFLYVKLGPTLDSYMEAIARQRLSRRLKAEEEVRRKVDDILEKISRHGIGTLTRKESQFLKNASKRFQKPRAKSRL